MRAELWGSKTFIDRYPQLTQLIATAYIKAAYWAAQPEHKDDIVKIGTRSGAPASVILREYEDGTPWKYRWSPVFESYVFKHYQHTIDYALDKKLIRKPLDVKELLDTRFVEQALKDLQLGKLLARRPRQQWRRAMTGATTSTISATRFLNFPGWKQVGGLVPLALLLLVWWFVCERAWFPPELLVPPQQVAAAFVELFNSGELGDHLRASLQRLAIGVGIGAVTGLILGVAMALSRRIEVYVAPLFHVVRQVPSIALIPVLILIFGIGETFKILIVIKAAFFPVALAGYTAVQGLPKSYFDVARIYRLPPLVAVSQDHSAVDDSAGGHRYSNCARSFVGYLGGGGIIGGRVGYRPDDGAGSANVSYRRRNGRRSNHWGDWICTRSQFKAGRGAARALAAA